MYSFNDEVNSEQNITGPSTIGKLRPDSIWFVGQVPICRIEEKDSDDDLEIAWSELTSKMVKWSSVIYTPFQKWILGLAVSKTTVRVAIISPSDHDSEKIDIRQLARLKMNRSFMDRLQYLAILVNFAKHVSDLKEQFSAGLRMPSITVNRMERERTSLYLCGPRVVKEYDVKPRYLDRFYCETKDLDGVEKLVSSGQISRKRRRGDPDGDEQPSFYMLEPVGYNLLPEERIPAIQSLIQTVQG